MTQPTDEEIRELWAQHAPIIGGVLTFTRAALANWGAPQQAAPAQLPQQFVESITKMRALCDEHDKIDRHKVYGRILEEHLEALLAEPQQAAPDQSVIKEAVGKLHMLLMPVPAAEVTALEVCKVVSEQAMEIINLLQQAAPAERKQLRTITYVCPVCAASLERQE